MLFVLQCKHALNMWITHAHAGQHRASTNSSSAGQRIQVERKIIHPPGAHKVDRMKVLQHNLSLAHIDPDRACRWPGIDGADAPCCLLQRPAGSQLPEPRTLGSRRGAPVCASVNSGRPNEQERSLPSLWPTVNHPSFVLCKLFALLTMPPAAMFRDYHYKAGSFANFT